MPDSPPSMQPQSPMPYYPPMYACEEDEINLLDYWRVMTKRKWQIILVTLFFFIAALVLTFLMPQKYTAQVALMPISSGGGGGGLAAMAAQVSSVPLLGGALGGLADKIGGNKGKELVNILKSRTVAESIVQRFDLMRVFFKEQWDPVTASFKKGNLTGIPVLEDAVAIFSKKIVKIGADKKSGLVKLKVTMQNNELAAKVANSMVVELQDFISNNSLTVEKRNRIFIEEQLVKNRVKLLEAGKALNQFYAENNVSSVVPQLDVSVGSYEPLAKTLEDFRKELESIHQQQGDVQKKIVTKEVSGVPSQVYLDYLTLNQQLLIKAHALLTQQFELSKIAEAKEDLAFQVLDKAKAMVRPSSPNLLLNVAIGFMGGFFFAVFLAFFREYIEKAKGEE